MRIEAADNVSAAMVVDDCRQRSRGIGPIKPQTDVTRRPRYQSLFDPVDRKWFGLARLCRRLHLRARLARRQRFDRLEIGLGHDLEHSQDLRMKVRHEAIRSRWSPSITLPSDDEI